MSRERYSYCFLRYHHDSISGEFGNIGILLWAPDSQFLGFKCSGRYSRLSKFFLDFEADDYRGLVSRLETQFSELSIEYAKDKYLPRVLEIPKSARDLALQIIPEDDGAIRWSRSQGGLTENPEVELEAIYQRFIGAKNQSSITERRNDKVVYDEVYKPVFEDAVVKPLIKSYTVVSPLVSHDFEKAWQNGCWNVYETLSFDYADTESIESKALKWDGKVRHLSEASNQPKVHLLLGSSREGHLKAYSKAKDILASSRNRSGVILIEENEVADFSNELRAKVTEHLNSGLYIDGEDEETFQIQS